MLAKYFSYNNSFSAALSAGALIVPLILFGVVAWQDRRSTLNEAAMEVSNTADVLREHALKVFETHELIATAIDEHIRGLSWEEIADSRAIHEYLVTLAGRYPQVQGLWLVDASGALRNSSRAPPIPIVNLSDRDYYVTLRDRDVGTFISSVVTGRVQPEENFNVVRRRSGAGAAF